MKRLFYMLSLVFLLLCSCSKREVDQGELAAIAAKGYYDLLLEGKYEEYVDGSYRPDSIPQNYRHQLILNAKMFMERQQEKHQGIKQVNVLNANVDTAHHVANVFLSVVYGDSIKEQVVLPMIQVADKWMMK